MESAQYLQSLLSTRRQYHLIKAYAEGLQHGAAGLEEPLVEAELCGGDVSGERRAVCDLFDDVFMGKVYSDVWHERAHAASQIGKVVRQLDDLDSVSSGLDRLLGALAILNQDANAKVLSATFHALYAVLSFLRGRDPDRYLRPLVTSLAVHLGSEEEGVRRKAAKFIHKMLSQVSPMNVLRVLLEDWKARPARFREEVMNRVAASLVAHPHDKYDMKYLIRTCVGGLSDADERVKTSSFECVLVLLMGATRDQQKHLAYLVRHCPVADSLGVSSRLKRRLEDKVFATCDASGSVRFNPRVRSQELDAPARVKGHDRDAADPSAEEEDDSLLDESGEDGPPKRAQIQDDVLKTGRDSCAPNFSDNAQFASTESSDFTDAQQKTESVSEFTVATTKSKTPTFSESWGSTGHPSRMTTTPEAFTATGSSCSREPTPQSRISASRMESGPFRIEKNVIPLTPPLRRRGSEEDIFLTPKKESPKKQDSCSEITICSNGTFVTPRETLKREETVQKSIIDASEIFAKKRLLSVLERWENAYPGQEGADLEPLLNPHQTVEAAFAVLCEPFDSQRDWYNRKEAIKNLLRIAKHHTHILFAHRRLALLTVCHHVRKVPVVARAALATLREIVSALGCFNNQEAELVMSTLLDEYGITQYRNMKEDIVKTLVNVISKISYQNAAILLTSIRKHTKSKTSVELEARLLRDVVVELGAQNCLVDENNMAASVITSTAIFLRSTSPVTRYYARGIIKALMTSLEFERLVRRHVPRPGCDEVRAVAQDIKRKGVGRSPQGQKQPRRFKSRKSLGMLTAC